MGFGISFPLKCLPVKLALKANAIGNGFWLSSKDVILQEILANDIAK